MEAKEKLKKEIDSAWTMLQYYESIDSDDSKDVRMWRHLWYAYSESFKIVYGEEYSHG